MVPNAAYVSTLGAFAIEIFATGARFCQAAGAEHLREYWYPIGHPKGLEARDFVSKYIFCSFSLLFVSVHLKSNTFD